MQTTAGRGPLCDEGVVTIIRHAPAGRRVDLKLFDPVCASLGGRERLGIKCDCLLLTNKLVQLRAGRRVWPGRRFAKPSPRPPTVRVYFIVRSSLADDPVDAMPAHRGTRDTSERAHPIEVLFSSHRLLQSLSPLSLARPRVVLIGSDLPDALQGTGRREAHHLAAQAHAYPQWQSHRHSKAYSEANSTGAVICHRLGRLDISSKSVCTWQKTCSKSGIEPIPSNRAKRPQRTGRRKSSPWMVSGVRNASISKGTSSSVAWCSRIPPAGIVKIACSFRRNHCRAVQRQ